MFNGTHHIRVERTDNAHGFRVMAAEADINGKASTDYKEVAWAQKNAYRERCELYAEIIRLMLD